MASVKNLSLFFLFHLLLVLLKADSKCPKSYPCRNFTIEFPFTDISDSKCGLFPVNCSSLHENPKVYFQEFPMDILEKESSNKFLIHDSVLANYFKSGSCFSFSNVSLPKSPSVSFTFSPNLTFFSCYNPSKDIQDYFMQYQNITCDILTIYYETRTTQVRVTDDALPYGSGCVVDQMPISPNQDSGNPFDILTPNFTLEWHVSQDCYECYDRGGQCLSNNIDEFYCKFNQGNVVLDLVSCMV